MAESETDSTKVKPADPADDAEADVGSADVEKPTLPDEEPKLPDVDASTPIPERPAKSQPPERTTMPPPIPKPRRPGRVLASLALLLSLAAVGAVGYLGYRAWLDDPEARFEAAIGTYQSDLAEFHRVTADQVAGLRAELARLGEELAAQRRAVSEARTAMADAVAANLDRAPPTPSAWKLAEVEYLLTIANHRLLMQQDAVGAQKLLVVADQLLAELDDFRFHEVRALLAAEELALRSFDYADTQRVFLRLEAVKGMLGRLPLRLPEYTSEDASEAGSDEDPSMLHALLDRLGNLVRFRRHHGEAVRPLLAPEEAEYLEQHLRLALDRAQLAALRRDQDIFSASLGAAREWLHRFVEPGRTAVVEATRELDELLKVDLDIEPPDISRSLTRLRELRWGGVNDEAAEE